MTVADYPDYATPQAHATAISTTGAPLLNLHEQTVTNSALSVPANTTVDLGTFTINQPGMIWRADPFIVGGGVVAPMQFVFTWSDSSSTFITRTKKYTAWPGNATTNHQITGYTRAHGDKVRVQVINTSATQNMQVAITVCSTSVPYSTERVFSRVMTALSSPNTLASYDLDQGVLCADQVLALAAGSTQQDQIALYQGRVSVSWSSQSGAADCSVNILQDASRTVGGQSGQLLIGQSDAFGHGLAQVCLPGSQCSLIIKNGNAAAKNVNFSVIAIDF